MEIPVVDRAEAKLHSFSPLLNAECSLSSKGLKGGSLPNDSAEVQIFALSSFCRRRSSWFCPSLPPSLQSFLP